MVRPFKAVRVVFGMKKLPVRAKESRAGWKLKPVPLVIDRASGEVPGYKGVKDTGGTDVEDTLQQGEKGQYPSHGKGHIGQTGKIAYGCHQAQKETHIRGKQFRTRIDADFFEGKGPCRKHADPRDNTVPSLQDPPQEKIS